MFAQRRFPHALLIERPAAAAVFQESSNKIHPATDHNGKNSSKMKKATKKKENDPQITNIATHLLEIG